MGTRRLCTADLETDPFSFGREPRPFAAGHYDGRRFRYWWGHDAVDRYAAFQRGRNDCTYFHNGGRFDFYLLSSYLAQRTELVVIDGRIVRAPMGRARLMDSYSVLPFALSHYDKLPVDWAWFEESEREQHRDRILEYLERDCTALYELVSTFRDRYGYALTLAQAGFRSLEQSVGIRFPRGKRSFDAKFRRWFFGGRIEAVRRGVHRGRWVHADMNSAYAAAMAEDGPFPFDHRWQSHRQLVDDPARVRRSFYTVRARSHGALPWRAEDRSVQWPDSSRELLYHVTGHELLAGIETGHVRVAEVVACHEFPPGPSFAPWVHELWAERRRAQAAGDRASELIAKAMLVGAFGKFGADPSKRLRFRLYPFHPLTSDLAADCAPESRMVHRYAGRLGRHWVWAQSAPNGHGYWNVATAASITGAVRARLWRALVASDRPLYVHTDAIVSARLGPTERVGEGLGEWSTEGPYRTAAIVSGRAYGLLDGPGPDHVRPRLPGLDGSMLRRAAYGSRVRVVSDAPRYTFGHQGPSFPVETVEGVAATPSAWTQPAAMMEN